MATQFTFARKELKYLVTEEQMDRLMKRLSEYMLVDSYGEYTINNIYYDTDDYDMIVHSLGRPLYKEKFRVRCYEGDNCDKEVFAEIKKKYSGIVYKRRIKGERDSVLDFVSAAIDNKDSTDVFDSQIQGNLVESTSPQIRREIEELLKQYHPTPKAMIAYERIALYGREDNELRLTFDKNIRGRVHDLDLSMGSEGDSVTDMIVMEIKLLAGMPLWLCDILASEKLLKTSFSKYGTFYTKYILRSISNA